MIYKITNWCVEIVYVEKGPNHKPCKKSLLRVFDNQREAESHLSSPTVRALMMKNRDNCAYAWEM